MHDEINNTYSSIHDKYKIRGHMISYRYYNAV